MNAVWAFYFVSEIHRSRKAGGGLTVSPEEGDVHDAVGKLYYGHRGQDAEGALAASFYGVHPTDSGFRSPFGPAAAVELNRRRTLSQGTTDSRASPTPGKRSR